jgi:hypothetical protein
VSLASSGDDLIGGHNPMLGQRLGSIWNHHVWLMMMLPQVRWNQDADLNYEEAFWY